LPGPAKEDAADRGGFFKECRSVERAPEAAKAAGPGVIAIAHDAHHVTPGESMVALGENKPVVGASDGRMCGRTWHCGGGEQRHGRDCDSGGADQQ
jgi:hypothetical protein